MILKRGRRIYWCNGTLFQSHLRGAPWFDLATGVLDTDHLPKRIEVMMINTIVNPKIVEWLASSKRDYPVIMDVCGLGSEHMDGWREWSTAAGLVDAVTYGPGMARDKWTVGMLQYFAGAAPVRFLPDYYDDNPRPFERAMKRIIR